MSDSYIPAALRQNHNALMGVRPVSAFFDFYAISFVGAAQPRF
ncbi:MAG: hypothetical protein ABI835_21190 [Chloroflexota bacterium]